MTVKLSSLVYSIYFLRGLHNYQSWAILMGKEIDMRICAISDLHGRLPDIPECDVLVIAGDVAPDHPRVFMTPREELISFQQRWFWTDYAIWEMSVPAKHIVAIPGNHDWCFELPEVCRTKWLLDHGITIEGKTFWGMPYVPAMGGFWNFECNPLALVMAFKPVPMNLDVLIAHAPPYRILDLTKDNERAGSKPLLDCIYEKNPRYVFSGHIHEGRRESIYMRAKNTMVYNVAMWGNDWKPTVLDI